MFIWKNYLMITVLISSVEVLIHAELQLQLLNVIFRHGDRTPAAYDSGVYPNDPYLNYSFPMGYKALTNKGKMRSYQLGEYLRQTYNEFLGDLYEPNEVYARSSDSDRTKMTLQVVLSAMYPPKESQQWNPDLKWQPTVTSYYPTEKDLLMMPDYCPLLASEQDRVNHLPEVVALVNEFDGFMENLTEFTGKNITTPEDMYNLYNTLESEASLNLALPSWTEDLFPHGRLLDGALLDYQIYNYSPLQKRLNGGQLLREFVKNMRQSIQNKNNGRKVYLYSGHQTNVGALLFTLGVYEPHVPEYTSAIIVQLFEDNGEHYVQVSYYKGIPAEIVDMVIQDCETLCPFEKFVDQLKNNIPSDEEVEVCLKQQ